MNKNVKTMLAIVTLGLFSFTQVSFALISQPSKTAVSSPEAAKATPAAPMSPQKGPIKSPVAPTPAPQPMPAMPHK